MDIFESLENLPVSEACFEDIVGLLEEKLKDRMTIGELRGISNKVAPSRYAELKRLEKKHGINATNQHLIQKIPELKRAQDRLSIAAGNAAGSKQYWNPKQTLEARHRNVVKTYPDSMTIAHAQAQETPKDNGVKYNYTPHINSVGKPKNSPKVGAESLPMTNYGKTPKPIVDIQRKAAQRNLQANNGGNALDRLKNGIKSFIGKFGKKS